jgi:hypothetical protein
MEEIMDQNTANTRIPLARRQLVGLADERGFTVDCLSGELWITADGLPGDHLLRAGEQLVLRGHPRVVVSALADADFRVTPCCGSSPIGRLAARCAAALADRIRRWRHAPLAAYPVVRLR